MRACVISSRRDGYNQPVNPARPGAPWLFTLAPKAAWVGELSSAQAEAIAAVPGLALLEVKDPAAANGTAPAKPVAAPPRPGPLGAYQAIAAEVPTDRWRPPVCDAPEVTLVVRHCNDRPDWFAAALDSALACEGVSVEVLVVDDGSTTLPALPDDPRLGLLALAYNQGLAEAHNRGVALARGEFIRFLDADDILPPGAVAQQVAALRADPAAQIVAGWCEPIDAEGKAIHAWRQWCQRTALHATWDRKPDSLQGVIVNHERNLLVGPSVLWRRTWAPPRLDPAQVTAEDGLFYRVPLATAPPGTLLLLDANVLRYRCCPRASNSGGGQDAVATFRRACCDHRVEVSRLTADLARRRPARPVKVAYLDYGLDYGGAQWAVALTASNLDRAYCEPRFFIARRSPLADWVEARGLGVTVCPPSTGYGVWLPEALRAWGADLADCCWNGKYVSAEVAQATRVVAHLQSVELRHSNYEEANRDRFAGWIAVSQDVADAHPWTAERGRVIPSPVDSSALRRAVLVRPQTRAALGLAEDDLAVIWSGRLTADEKRADVLREVIAACARLAPRLRFVLLGAVPTTVGRYAETVADWTAWTAAHGVRWIRDAWPWQLPACYAAGDLYLSVSAYEGMSLSQLEAMAAGCVPVCTDVAGVRYTLRDGVNGLVIADPDEAPAALAKLAAMDDDERRAMGHLARHAAAALCDVRACARAHEAYYLDLLDAAAKPARARRKPTRSVDRGGTFPQPTEPVKERRCKSK